MCAWYDISVTQSVDGGDHGATRDVTLHLKHGVEAKNYEDVSFKSKTSAYGDNA